MHDAENNEPMPEIPPDVPDDARSLRRAFFLASCFAAFLWLIALTDLLLDLNLARYGVYPRTWHGLDGILWAPLIHGSLSHLFANTAPIIVLGSALLYAYAGSARIVIPAVYLGTGLGVWLFARNAYHIGASGLTFGAMFFIFTIGILRWDKRAIVLAMVVFFLYGSMIWGIFPTRPDISFEAHLFGAVLGVALAILLRQHDPAPQPKKYSWEDEEDEEDNDENAGNHVES